MQVSNAQTDLGTQVNAPTTTIATMILAVDAIASTSVDLMTDVAHVRTTHAQSLQCTKETALITSVVPLNILKEPMDLVIASLTVSGMTIAVRLSLKCGKKQLLLISLFSLMWIVNAL